MKAAQLGVTETGINRAFFTLDQSKRDVLYVLPTSINASDFSKARFTTALKLSAYLKNLFTDTNTVGLKSTGTNVLYIRGSRGDSNLKSIPASELVLDELDEMDIHAGSTWLRSRPIIDIQVGATHGRTYDKSMNQPAFSVNQPAAGRTEMRYGHVCRRHRTAQAVWSVDPGHGPPPLGGQGPGNPREQTHHEVGRRISRWTGCLAIQPTASWGRFWDESWRLATWITSST